jgi:hypothetical protein
MTRDLRQTHRATFYVLALMLPVSFAIALIARKPAIVSQSAPIGPAVNELDSTEVIWTRMDLWPGHNISSTLHRDAKNSVGIELTCHDLPRPDLLLYWVANPATPADALPADALFLGAVRGGKLIRVPDGIRGESGLLVIYSLADNEVLARSNLFIIGKS